MIFSNMNKHKSFIARFDVAQVATKTITITKSWRLEVQFHIGHAENVKQMYMLIVNKQLINR